MFKPFGDQGGQRTAVFSGPECYGDVRAIEHLVAACLDSLELPEGFFRSGDRVVLKPNWVKEHDERHPGPGQWEHVVTHPAVIEAVIRWVGARLRDGSI